MKDEKVYDRFFGAAILGLGTGFDTIEQSRTVAIELTNRAAYERNEANGGELNRLSFCLQVKIE